MMAKNNNSVCLVTVCNNHNCGSFLQAFALYKMTSAKGIDVKFLDIPRDEHSAKKLLGRSVKAILRKKPQQCRIIVDEFKGFRPYLDSAKGHSCSFGESAGYDRYLIGSDTVWDLSRPYYSKMKSWYWGSRFDEGKKISSYAASIGTAFFDAERSSYAKESLSRFSQISVRDDFTKEMVESLGLSQVAEKVCDPTMLLTPEEWGVYSEDVSKYGRYMLVYAFAEFPSSVQKTLIDLARSEGLKIVSLGEYRKWCDCSVAANPSLFLGLFKSAEYILTDTFHGSVFSIIFNKRFVSYDRGKAKVQELHSQFQLNCRLVCEADDLREIITSPINFDSVNESIEAIRERSASFLSRTLEM